MERARSVNDKVIARDGSFRLTRYLMAAVRTIYKTPKKDPVEMEHRKLNTSTAFKVRANHRK